ncbi:MAG: hypothetical protein K2Y37_04990 [Pirellulales bacterium]|nr:hypothetical protein [Pirellulales bacterium]
MVLDRWLAVALDRLAERPVCGYVAAHAPAAEPTSLAALALIAHARLEAAQTALGWLQQLQAADGSVGVRAGEPRPGWPTALAICAWQAAIDRATDDQAHAIGRDRLATAVKRGVEWLLAIEGVALKPTPAMGHDPSIVGWPWVASTHSWLEPTAWAVLALRAAGQGDHLRTRDGLRLIEDRLLATGGCNYGNTSVLGQVLRPHIQPTGLALLALSGRATAIGKVARSCDYLTKTLDGSTAALSLSYGLMGLAAQHRIPEQLNDWLETACARTLRQGKNLHALALLSLAAAGDRGPLVLYREGAPR